MTRTMHHRAALTACVLSLATCAALPAGAQLLGSDAAACQAGGGPAVEVTVTGLKDRAGAVRLELYPATPDDFLKGDHELGFRRVSVAPPKEGPVAICIRVPHPGRYALVMIHERDGKMKFDYRIDGAGTPSNRRLGFGKPKLPEALITVGAGVTPIPIRAQYLGLFGFSPSSAK